MCKNTNTHTCTFGNIVVVSVVFDGTTIQGIITYHSNTYRAHGMLQCRFNAPWTHYVTLYIPGHSMWLIISLDTLCDSLYLWTLYMAYYFPGHSMWLTISLDILYGLLYPWTLYVRGSLCPWTFYVTH